jgi:hypothetical protein
MADTVHGFNIHVHHRRIGKFAPAVSVGAEAGKLPRVLRKDARMAEKPVLIPGPDHPITVQPSPDRVVVTFAGR